MQLKDKVGRFATTGRSCQNWKKDQELVISLLNKIPISDGGAENMLKPELVVTGHASDSLYSSILYFQQKNFPGPPDGYIRPGGPTYTKLTMLSGRAAATPAPQKGQWGNVATPSVYNSLTRALNDDLKLDYAEVIDIIRATVTDGMVTAFELDDLMTILSTSRSLSATSKKLINLFIADEKKPWFGVGPYDLNSNHKKIAADMICDFLKNTRTTYFPKLDPHRIGIGLLRRVANPSLIDQDQASLCGPAAMMFSYASDKPGHFARFAIDLYQKGQANLGRLLIKPGRDVRNYAPDSTMDHCDWLTLASLRDSENWFLDYDSAGKELAGITLPSEMEQWFRKSGYRDTREDTNLTNMMHKGIGTIDDVNELFRKGYRICLFISANMTEDLTLRGKSLSDPSDMWEDDQSRRGSIMTRHWVVVRSLIEKSNGTISLTVFSWGKGEYKIPHGNRPLTTDEFLMNFYGYVAGKP